MKLQWMKSVLVMLLVSVGVGCTRPAPTGKPAATVSVPKSPTAPAPAQAVEEESTYSLRFERTPCMGKCPAYALTIESDGRARYVGQAYAPLEGEKALVFPNDVLRTAEKLLTTMQFEQMPEDEYGHGMMDAPAAIVTWRLASGELKTVRCTGGECPDQLLDLHRYLDAETRRALGVEGEE